MADSTPDAARPAWRQSLDTPRGLACLASLVSFAVLAATAPGIPIVWDEGEYFWRAGHSLEWFRLVAQWVGGHTDVRPFAPDVIHEYWHFVTWDEGHPDLGAVPLAAGRALLGGVLHPLTAARMGTVALFSAACGGVAYRLRQSDGAVAAVVAVVALLTLPRLFAEAHFATLDGQLTAWWLLLWAGGATPGASAGNIARTGLLAGLTSATKFTGWLAWPPMVATRLLSGRRQDRLALFGIIPIGLLVFFVVNPPLWHHPIASMTTHVRLNLHRELNVPMAFFGTVYDLNRSLPWYNTLAWLAIVTPVPVLLLGSCGLWTAVRRRDAIGVGLVLQWAVLMLVRAFPHTPPHDGIRLLLPAFGFWCLLAGVGAQYLWTRSEHPLVRRLVKGAIAVGLAGGVVNVARYYPQTLSHYNLLVGGVKGAARLGMEPTYWWDGLDADALDWLNTHTAPGERVAFSSTANIALLNEWGRLTPTQAPRGGVFKWYVFQNRTSFLADSDRVMLQTLTPSYVTYAGRHTAGHVPADLDVPLVLVYSFEQYHAALATADHAASRQ